MAAPIIAVLASGLVSGLGDDSESCCAAIRCGANNFQETAFTDGEALPIVGSAAQLEGPYYRAERLVKLAAGAVSECMGASGNVEVESIPIFLCLAEPGRPGRLAAVGPELLRRVETELGMAEHASSRVLELGRVGGAVALLQARRALVEGRCTRCIVAGADTYLTEATLRAYGQDDRLLTRSNSNGFIPGEAAAAVVLGRASDHPNAALTLHGLGFAREPSPFGSGRPLRADGLVKAMSGALAEAGIGLAECYHRIADLNGEQYRFKEAALAITRLLRDRKVGFSVWHPASCLGEIGAATLPTMLAILTSAARHQYLPGPTVLGHLGNDDSERAAFIARTTIPQPLSAEAEAETAYTLRRRSAV